MEQVSTALRQHMKDLILRACDVKGVAPEEVDEQAILFAPDNKLGLTSLDAIEIATDIERQYQVKMQNLSTARECFRSVETLCAHVEKEADPQHLRTVLGLRS